MALGAETAPVHAFKDTLVVIPEAIGTAIPTSGTVTFSYPRDPHVKTTIPFTIRKSFGEQFTSIPIMSTSTKSASCTPTQFYINVLRLGTSVAGVTPDNTRTHLITTIAAGDGQLQIVSPIEGVPETGPTLPDAEQPHFIVTSSLKLGDDALRLDLALSSFTEGKPTIGSIALSILSNQESVYTSEVIPLPKDLPPQAPITNASDWCMLISAVGEALTKEIADQEIAHQQTIVEPIRHSGSDLALSLKELDVSCPAGDGMPALTLKGQVSDLFGFNTPINVEAEYKQGGPNQDVGPVYFNVTTGVDWKRIFPSNPPILSLKPADISFRVGSASDRAVETRLRMLLTINGGNTNGSPIEFTADPQGLTLAVDSATTLTFKNNLQASLTDLRCAYDLRKLDFKSCRGAVSVSIPSFGGALRLNLAEDGRITFSQSPVVDLGNGYTLKLECPQLLVFYDAPLLHQNDDACSAAQNATNAKPPATAAATAKRQAPRPVQAATADEKPPATATAATNKQTRKPGTQPANAQTDCPAGISRSNLAYVEQLQCLARLSSKRLKTATTRQSARSASSSVTIAPSTIDQSLSNLLNHVALTAKTATLSGGVLGTKGLTISSLFIGNDAVCGQITTAPSLAVAGPFQVTNVHAVITTSPLCSTVNESPNAGTVAPAFATESTGTPTPGSSPSPVPTVVPGISLTTDLSLRLNDSADTDQSNAINASVVVKQLSVNIPFSGKAITLSAPYSVTITGSLFGRSLVGVCPSALATNGTLPSLAAGSASAGADDLSSSSSVFRILTDGSYQVCAGLHLTPNAATTSTSDLVDVLLAINPPTDTAPNPTIGSARVVYAGDGVSTRVGTATLSVKKIDLSYIHDRTQRPHPTYTVGNGNVALNCAAALSGSVTIGLQGIAAVGSSGSSLDTQLGIGQDCLFADLSGRVTFQITNTNSVVLKELHFGSGPAYVKVSKSDTTGPPFGDVNSKIWYTRANVEVNVGQGGLAENEVGLDNFTRRGATKPDDQQLNVSAGKTDAWRTAQMNVGWIVSGITGLFAGLWIHH